MIYQKYKNINLIYFALIPIFLCISGCELITIGSQKKQTIHLDQTSAIGSILLFKNELDSNNIHGATRLLAKNSGKFLLAFEKYEQFPDIFKLMSIVNNLPVTYYTTDTLSVNQQKIFIEFDYLRQFSIYTYKINDIWFITDFNGAFKEN